MRACARAWRWRGRPDRRHGLRRRHRRRDRCRLPQRQDGHDDPGRRPPPHGGEHGVPGRRHRPPPLHLRRRGRPAPDRPRRGARGHALPRACLAITVRDLDAPGGTFTHWLIRDLDANTRRLSAGAHPPGAVEGRDSFGRTGYSGPCPPHGDRPHHYVLTVYATDRRPPLAPSTSPGVSPDDLPRALTGRYGR
ncbi:YbhB/YbcL family Raf kinase inhibitor-like protein [Streptomyces sp. S816]|uniref:YbhB/YbcL family Raf kinase inhibitor-like protein n=1 Tax=Streptomyces sp. S816 TaxID=2283197 RepID=UPI002492EBFC|nr:YbhB/YbcL family Raf kinase inhibitor-like protein [Streptomyces sp. S816]